MDDAASTERPATGPDHDGPTEPVRTIAGACPHDCPDTCALLTQVDARDRIVRVQGNPAHAWTAGVLCAKVSRYPERTDHADRVLRPLRRTGPKGSGRFEPIGWDEALDTVAQRLGPIAARDAEAILPYSYAGTMGFVQGDGMGMRFFHRLGASLLDRTICSSPGGEALQHTLGGRVGMKVQFFAESKLILIWGSNPITSHLHFWRLALQAQRAGARLVCIDPRRSETAERCDEHVALMPGTDAALALGLMHELIANGHLDEDWLDAHTLGWPALRERALQWPPARVARVCGIPEQQVKRLAHDYGTIRPAAIRLNYGMQRVHGGGNAVRAVACLPALIGAWRDRAGGALLSSGGHFPVRRAQLQRPDLLGKRRPRTINMVQIGDALNVPAGPGGIEAVVVWNSNPVAVAPDSSRVVAGFAREHLFTVVLEHFMTDTARHADIVLPATTQLEHWDIHASYGHTDVLLNRPAIAPRGEALPNAEIFRRLARRMGFDEPCFADDDETMCRQAFGDAVDFGTLMRDGFASLPVPDAPFASGGFPTPSGRVEMHSAALAARGLDPLPDHVPNHEPAGADPRWPLAMISPPARNFLNSTFVNLQPLRAREGGPLLEIHPDDAAPRGIDDGARVRVHNARGSHECIARVSTRARPGVVVGLGIWWRSDGLNGTNVNELTSQALTDLGRGPTFYDCAVQVEAQPSPVPETER